MARAVVAIAGFGTVGVLVFALGLGAPEPNRASTSGAKPSPVTPSPALETAIAPATSAPSAPSAKAEAASSASSRIRIVASAQPKTAQWYLDDVEMGSNPLQTSAPRDMLPHTLRAEAKGFEPVVKTLVFDANIDVTVVLTPKK